MTPSSAVKWQVSGVRVKLGGQPFILITDVVGNGWVYIPYSDRTNEQHIEAYKDANFIVDAHNKALVQ